MNFRFSVAFIHPTEHRSREVVVAAMRGRGKKESDERSDNDITVWKVENDAKILYPIRYR